MKPRLALGCRRWGSEPVPSKSGRRGGRFSGGLALCGGQCEAEAGAALDLEMQWQWMERVFLWRSILIFRVSLLVCTAGNLFAQATCPDITVTQQLLKEGFHRDLLTKVELGAGDEAIGSCTVAIKEHLPTGLYVDPYELASLQQHNLTEALMIPDIVDVESPEYLATDLAIVVYMKPDPQCASCFKAMLPVHCRYHRPTEDDGEALTLLKSPEILIHCHKSNPHPREGELYPLIWIFKMGVLTVGLLLRIWTDKGFPSVECWKYSEVEAPCSVRNRHTCHWNIVKYKHVNTEVILKVPVGLKQHGTLDTYQLEVTEDKQNLFRSKDDYEPPI
ncbi:phosphatidylinositol-glycan biosynthesis class X protein isoform X2 [Mauremys reevesii]|uniref:phosphatidylinositol-glycan biosynthesis class X protein isoform X2 n=1 Tax=Mauremys reevesii TaxID=260615 RepID=UPI00193EF733|nr:phosphatidylinositol-glycan biosynthesis class X protein isoform X2 [Mauremys reevesii]